MLRRDENRRILVGAVVSWLFIVLVLNQLSFLNVQWWLEPDHEEAAHLCHTVDIRVEHGLEQGFIGYAQHTQGRLFLYSTIVVRETLCQLKFTILPANELNLHYRDVYLNVTHRDVTLEAERLKILYPQGESYNTWRYQRSEAIFQFQPYSVDVHGFVLHPLKLEVNGGFVGVFYWLLKFISCVMSTIVLYIALHYGNDLFTRFASIPQSL
jgi:hypothetical protein